MSDIETSTRLDARFGADGLIPAIAQDAETGEVLMLAWMNAEALAQTLRTKRATYWSRARQALWVKGETSGHSQEVLEARIDCDQDAILLRVRQAGPACHTGAKSCFYRRIGENGALSFKS
jgi:phosphoribosyl-AMP cyclohydrolase